VTFLLGLDIGSTTTKAALVDVTDVTDVTGAPDAPDGVTVVRIARRPTPGDVESLIAAAAAVVRECSAAASAPIAAVGIASMAESGAALDAAAALGSPGRPAASPRPAR
jgi:sugar (pentulose or hexulose) kinase